MCEIRSSATCAWARQPVDWVGWGHWARPGLEIRLSNGLCQSEKSSGPGRANWSKATLRIQNFRFQKLKFAQKVHFRLSLTDGHLNCSFFKLMVRSGTPWFCKMVSEIQMV